MSEPLRLRRATDAEIAENRRLNSVQKERDYVAASPAKTELQKIQRQLCHLADRIRSLEKQIA